MDQTDQTGFQEYYSKVSSLQIQHSVIGELLGWATKPVKKGDKRANIPSQYRSSRLNKNCFFLLQKCNKGPAEWQKDWPTQIGLASIFSSSYFVVSILTT